MDATLDHPRRYFASRPESLRPSLALPPLIIHHLDVHQGNCTLIEFPQADDFQHPGGEPFRPILIDCGITPLVSTEKAAQVKQRLGETFNHVLGKYGNTFEAVVVSHADNDHCNLLPLENIVGERKVKHLYFGGSSELYTSPAKKKGKSKNSKGRNRIEVPGANQQGKFAQWWTRLVKRTTQHPLAEAFVGKEVIIEGKNGLCVWISTANTSSGDVHASAEEG